MLLESGLLTGCLLTDARARENFVCEIWHSVLQKKSYALNMYISLPCEGCAYLIQKAQVSEQRECLSVATTQCYSLLKIK